MRASEDTIFWWDGRVLEVFDRGASERFHCEHIEITQKGPDRKGRCDIRVTSKRGGGISMSVDESHAPEVLALIEEVNAASGD